MNKAKAIAKWLPGLCLLLNSKKSSKHQQKSSKIPLGLNTKTYIIKQQRIAAQCVGL
jgi:hypothetical protein